MYLPKDPPWLSDFLHEMLAFPNGAMTIRSTASRNFSTGRRASYAIRRLHPTDRRDWGEPPVLA